MKKRKIKRVIANAMALLMMINALPVTDGWFHPMTSYASTARVNATSLNVRSGPGTTYSIAGKLTNGKTVTVLGQTTGSDGKTWSQIRFTGTGGAEITGYVLSTYLKNPTSYSHDGNFESYLTSQGFPESYKDGLRLLHAEYPNWVFTAQHTNLDWNTVIENESVVGRNLVYTSSISSWKSIADGAYNWDTSTWPGFDSSSYVAASSDIIKYYMDPRNFLDDKYVFQFLTHSYDSSAQTAEGLKSMVQGTFLSGSTTATGTSGSSYSSGGPGVSGSAGSSSSDTSLTGPGVSGNSNSSNSSSTNSSGPGSSSSSGSSNSGVSLTGPGTGASNSSSTSSSSSGIGTSGNTGSANKSNVSFEAPGKTSGASWPTTVNSSSNASIMIWSAPKKTNRLSNNPHSLSHEQHQICTSAPPFRRRTGPGSTGRKPRPAGKGHYTDRKQCHPGPGIFPRPHLQAPSPFGQRRPHRHYGRSGRREILFH